MINDSSEGADFKNYFQKDKHTEIGQLTHTASKESNLLLNISTSNSACDNNRSNQVCLSLSGIDDAKNLGSTTEKSLLPIR